MKSLSCVQLFATPWTVAYQAPPSMEFSRQEYWSGLPFLSLRHVPLPGIKPNSPSFASLAGRLFTAAPPRKPTLSLEATKMVSSLGTIVRAIH